MTSQVGVLKDRWFVLQALVALSVLYAICLYATIDGADNPDPQAYKCKHGNAPGVCFKCWLEQQQQLPKPTPVPGS